MNIHRKAWLITPLILLAPMSSACSAPEYSDEPFTIGYVGDFSSEVGLYDRSGLAGAEYEIARLNANGGFGGRRIEILTEDIAGDPARSAGAARRLADAGAEVLFVPPLPQLARGAVVFAADLGLPTLSVGGTIPTILTGGEGTAFLAAFGDNVQAAAAAEYARDRHFDRAFTITSPDITDYSSTVPVYFAETFERLGGELAGTVDIPLDDNGYLDAAEAVASMPTPPDLVYTAIHPPELTSLLRALRERGFAGPVFTADGSETEGLFAAGDALGEVVLTAHAYSSSNRLSGLLFSPRSPAEKIARFAEGYERFHGAAPEILSFAALGADAVAIVHAAVDRADSTESTEIIDAIGALDHVEVTTGRITYDGQSGIPLKVVYVLRADDGRFELLRAIEPEWAPERLTAPTTSG